MIFLCILMITAFTVRWLTETNKSNDLLQIHGYGIMEPTPNLLVDRPNGTGDFLFMQFLNGAKFLDNHGQIISRDKQFYVLWKPSERQYYQGLTIKSKHNWIHFKGELIEQLLEDYSINSSEMLLLSEGFFKSILELIHEEHETLPDQINLKSLFQLMISKASNACQRKVNQIPKKYYKVQSFLEQHLAQNMRLSDLAKIANCSIPHFCANYKKYFGQSAIQYSNNLRLSKAEFYLKDKEKNISEIAELLGFCDLFQFSKQFKKKFGLSPLQYRKKILTQQEN